MLVVLLWLLTGNALSQTPGAIQISGQVIGQGTEGGLGGVAWRMEGMAY
jgi:hypothetical protein